MKSNFKLTIEYDGTPFYGWQIQKDRQTIQGTIQKALSIILNQPIHLTGSGRTDAGVHAHGQVAHFHAETKLTCDKIQKGLNSIIKEPIIVVSCECVPLDFHARFHAKSKEYHYHILNTPIPCALGRNYVWHISKELDLKQMQKCASLIIGEHDFKSFENAGSPRAHSIRKIFKADISRLNMGKKSHVVFKIRGNGFLRGMVRNIVGTLVQAGLAKLNEDVFCEIIAAKDRSAACETAPPQGLFLMEVNY